MFFKKDNEKEKYFFVKICALLIHAAKIDENFTESEEEIIKKTIKELGLNSLDEIDEPTLSSVLSYHIVLSTNQLSANFSGGMEFTTSLGENLIFNFNDTGDGVLTDNNERTSNIIQLDIQADNGIIHAIDTVVLP